MSHKFFIFILFVEEEKGFWDGPSLLHLDLQVRSICCWLKHFDRAVWVLLCVLSCLAHPLHHTELLVPSLLLLQCLKQFSVSDFHFYFFSQADVMAKERSTDVVKPVSNSLNWLHAGGFFYKYTWSDCVVFISLWYSWQNSCWINGRGWMPALRSVFVSTLLLSVIP